PSWDLAYGLFKKGKGHLVLSYWTSPAYHIEHEKIEYYKAARFKEGHYQQQEFAAIVPQTKNKNLARKFIEFLKQKQAQEIIAAKNLLYPVNPDAELPPAYSKIGKPKLLEPLKPNELVNLPKWLGRWRN